MASEILRIKDLAALLDVTPATIHNMLNSDRIPVPPIDGLKPRRWNAAEVRQWLQDRQS